MYARDWCYDKTLVVLDEKMDMRTALGQMHDSKANCALLYSSENVLLGTLDTRDIIRFVLRTSTSMHCSPRKAIRQCVVAPANVSVSEICGNLCSGIRYIAVCSSNGGHQLVSQRAMVAAIVEASIENDSLSTDLTAPVSNIIGRWNNIVTCHTSDKAKRAFEKMAAYEITSLPVVGDGKIIFLHTCEHESQRRLQTSHHRKSQRDRMCTSKMCWT